MIEIIIISAIIGIICWIVGIVLSIAFLVKTDETLNMRVLTAIIVLIIMGLLGLFFNKPALTTPIKNITTTYENPTHILKTNNVVHVIYIANNCCLVNSTFYESIYWNSTNILIKIINGKNLYNYPVRPTCTISLGKNENNE